jgi:hypothetical protein
VFGDGACWGRWPVCVDVLAVHVLGSGMEGAAVLAAGVALLETVELDFWGVLEG